MFLFGALGGLLPILASLLTVDVAPIIDHAGSLTIGNYVGYVIRVGILLFLGGVIALLNSDVRQPLTLVQLGISAPALVTAYINSVPPNQLKIPKDVNASISFIAPANADEAVARPQVQLAGGFLADVMATVSGRVDAAAVNNAHERLAKPVEKPKTEYPSTRPTISPALGSYCLTSEGRFGPGPVNEIGKSCSVSRPHGAVSGIVSQ